MFRYYRFDIELHPNETALELYAPNWETAEQSAEYQQLLAEHQPHSIRIAEREYRHFDGKAEMRDATPEEITLWTSGIMRPEPNVWPSYHYRYFGNQTILAPLLEKIEADHVDYTKEWQTAYAAGNGSLPQELLEQIAVVNTVYGNLSEAAHCYPPEYMAALAAEEHPLRILSYFYQKANIFAIEQTTVDLLATVHQFQSDYQKQGGLLPEYMAASNHDERMELLDTSLDRELAEYVDNSWNGLDFEESCEKAMEMFTLRQLYQTLRHDKHLYPAEQLDILAKFKNPLSVDKYHIVGERGLCQFTLDELNAILPQIYPDVEATPDIWSVATTADQGDAIEPEDNAEEASPSMTNVN